MLTFYFSKGSSALAAHILLIETGTAFTATEISIPNGDHRNTAFLRRNPKGRIPVLDTPDGLLTENPAILEYIAATHPEAGLLPKGPYPQARARALCAYLCATAHVAFAHLHRGARWASKEASLDDMRARVPDNLADCAAHLETDLPFSPWALGAAPTFCDPYLFQFTRWLEGAGVNITTYPKLAEHRAAMRARAAVQQAMKLHDLR
ncbi:glutathione S-transferase family protein [Sulfitobacter sp. TSTF-M16]|uniref:Glutathione S-transferase family protein n=1 Tax=Sulfitobacter aestuariivivens TaxID=2766981 RepID=A0A927D8H8_9RHOB|nr:glutathione S-transferase family protein [Sulfitobacter aestuariivivens]MBD3664711.1 glutathione S-transferase family protein [Sulfitobacter aestuariivivens]